MKYLRQFLIIILISFVGELLKIILPLPVPASIYGMLILFILLESGMLKLAAVKETGDFLMEIMPVMFIPAGVGLVESWGILKPMLLNVVIVTIVTSLTVMIFSGLITQKIIRHKGGRKE